MLSPFAPLYPWLLSAVMFDTPMCVRPNGRARLVSIQRTRADGPTQYKFAEHRATWTSETPDLDLRHGPTRYAILRALADVGHPRTWALGAPWSPLTDEQAGRAAAEIVRTVGPDPAHPAAVVPIGIFGAWALHSEGSCWDRKHIIPQAKKSRRYWYLRAYTVRYGFNGAFGDWYISLDNPSTHGPETGEPGRLAADNAARALGCIMIEDVTP